MALGKSRLGQVPAQRAQVSVDNPTVLAALVSLAQGFDVAPIAGDGPVARAINEISARLRGANSGAGLPNSRSILNPYLYPEAEAAGLAVFIGLLGVPRLPSLRRQIGSEIVDAILQNYASQVRQYLPDAVTGRIGRTNIEFAFLAEDDAAAQTALTRLAEVLAGRQEVEGQSFELGIAFGCARRDVCDESVLDDAALALGQAQASNATVSMFEEVGRIAAQERLTLLRDLRQAMVGDQLLLAYQPKYRSATDEVDQVEALIRWRHPVRGLVSPVEFIGPAEETGLIGDLTQWVLRRAIRDQAQLARQGYDLTVDINLSAVLLGDAAFTAWVIETLRADAVGPIGIEITETAIIADPVAALRDLHAYAAANVRIAIDDYGSGLSSLAYLRQLPANELKIDRMFVSELTSSHRDPLLVRSTIDLAHALGMEVTAEGVDNAATVALLRIMGCDLIQGYVVSPPLDVAALEAFLRAGPRLQVTAPTIPGFIARAKWRG